MDLQFKGLPDLFKKFPDDAAARHYFEAQRWQGCPVCPFCGSMDYYKLNDGKTYKCATKTCYKKYTVTVGTPLHGSPIGLHIWFAGMYLLSSHKKGISSHQLARDLGITQKSAWFMLHRLRDMVRSKEVVKLSGIIEIDETYMGRRFRTDMSNLTPEEIQYRLNNYYTSKAKGAVFGMVARHGNIIVKAYDGIKQDEILSDIKKHVTKHSWVMTDGSNLYRDNLEGYKHESVIHSRKEYVKGDIHTNRIENFWGLMKRGIYGIYHQISYKHLQRYCDEFAFRYNNRKIADNTRFELSLTKPQGRLTYKQLISGKIEQEPYQETQSEWE